MATIEITGVCCERPTTQLGITVRAVFAAFLRRRRERRALAPLARLSPHLIRDMGFDPEAVHAAVNGSWDDLTRGRYRPW